MSAYIFIYNKKLNALIYTKVQGVAVCSRRSRQRKTPPPVTGLISSHKQAASSTLCLRDKKRAIELHNLSPGRRHCH